MSVKVISQVVTTEHCTAVFVRTGDEIRLSSVSVTAQDMAVGASMFAKIEAELDDIRRAGEALKDAV